MKVKAHAGPQDLISGTASHTEVMGNYIADALAGLGADLHKAGPGEVMQVKCVDELARRVLNRHLAINLSVAKSEQPVRIVRVRRPRAKPTPIEVLVRSSAHDLAFGAGLWRCRRCAGSCTSRAL
eukprot:14813977-Alexandrium_andersonii.AAC.1